MYTIARSRAVLEIEQKFAEADFADLERRLHAFGAQMLPAEMESDHYFNAPDRDFAASDEAFRLRQIGSRSVLTYKGPRRSASVKTRTEIEVPLADEAGATERCLALVGHLGYRPVAIVRKKRQPFQLSRERWQFTVCLDDVEGLGHFAEVEVLAREEDAAAAQQAVADLAHELNLSRVEPRSYLGIQLTLRGKETP